MDRHNEQILSVDERSGTTTVLIFAKQKSPTVENRSPKISWKYTYAMVVTIWQTTRGHRGI